MAPHETAHRAARLCFVLIPLAFACGQPGQAQEPDPAPMSAGAGSSDAGTTSAAGATVGGGGTTSAGAGGAPAAGQAGSLGSAGNGVVPGADELPPDADHPYIQYFGRWDHSDPKAAVGAWGAIYVKARFTGSSLAVRLVDEQLTVPNGVGTGNVYQFQIDDGAFQELPSTAATEYTLATGLDAGEHSVTLVRRTESKFGTTTFHGFSLDSDQHLVVPEPRPERRLEVFGDSISAGLANENRGNYRNVNENGYAAFGPELARLLEAEWRVEARGGGSLLNDTWLPMIPWFDKLVGPLELQHLPASGAALWSFETWQPDVFILALGTNDSSDMYPASDEAAYVNKYKGFLSTIRGAYPSAEIFAVAPFKQGAPWDLVRAHIPLAVSQLADAKVHAVVPLSGASPSYSGEWLSYPADYVSGDEYHPNLDGNAKIAAELAALIAPIMGW
jgi:lysophospholipase L1-like esterase